MGDFIGGSGSGSNAASLARDKWVCPNDRQLALRAKLRTGWSVKSSRLHSFTKPPQPLDDTEQEAIMTVIKRAENIERLEQERVGRLVEKLENMKRNAIGNGNSQCILCGDDFGLLGASNLACNDCRKAVCSKCGVDTFSAQKEPLWLCKICAETREMWKKSGAWFFKGLPKYVLPEKKAPRVSSIKSISRGSASTTAAVCGSPPPPPSSDSLAQRPPVNAGSPGTERRASSVSETSSTSSSSSAFRSATGAPPPKPARNFNTWSKGAIGASGYSPATLVQRHGGLLDSEVGAVDRNEVTSTTHESNATHYSSDEPEVETTVTAGQGILSPGSRVRRRNLDAVGRSGGTEQPRSARGRAPSPIVVDGSAAAAGDSRDQDDGSQPTSTVDCSAASVDDVDRAVISYRRRSSNAGGQGQQMDFVGREDSVASQADVFDGDVRAGSPQEEEEDTGTYGTLEFSLLYDSINGALHCTIHRAKSLRAMDCNGLSDPYVKLHMLPGASKSNKLRTKTVHKTLNPEFNETLTYYGVTESDVARKTLRLSVLDDDAFGHDFVGEARVPLKQVRPHQTKHFHVYLDRQHPLEKDDDLLCGEHGRGKILLSLRYSNQRQALVVGIVRCSNLPSMDSNGFSDPFVRVQLKPDPQKKRYKTAIKWKNLNPEFNEEFAFDLKVSELTKRLLVLTVWDKDYGRTNDYLGGLQIGISSKGGRLRHWLDVVRNPDHRHDRWHHLGEEVLSD